MYKISDDQNYAQILSNIFGESISITPTKTNNVIGALNNDDNFKRFKTNYIARLQRLHNKYCNTCELDIIKNQAILVADNKNWQGAYAELVVEDLFAYIFEERQKFDMTYSNKDNDSCSKKMGYYNLNLDIVIEPLGFYCDVKVFKDNISEILNGIYSDLSDSFGLGRLNIVAEYSYDMSHKSVERNRNKLKSEIETSLFLEIRRKLQKIKSFFTPDMILEDFRHKLTTVDEEMRRSIDMSIKSIGIHHIQSKVVPQITFKVNLGKKCVSTTASYNPIKHAESIHNIIFNYVKKLSFDKATFIVLVDFCWYSGVVCTPSKNKEFLKAFADNVFCKYANSSDKFSSINKKYKGKESIFEITQLISGIIFVEDNCVLSNSSESINAKSFVYMNPNRILSPTSQFMSYLNSSKWDYIE